LKDNSILWFLELKLFNCFFCLDITRKFKAILTQLPAPKPLKQKLDAVVRKYKEDNLDALKKMIVDTYDLLSSNNSSSSETMKSTSDTTSTMTNQKKLNDIFDELEILLSEAVPNLDDLPNFNEIKAKLRELFVHIEKQNDELREDIITLKSRMSSLEQLENDDNIIKIGNIALQLRNKLVRFIKPKLSQRAARDECVDWLQTEEGYQRLSDFIKVHDADLCVSDLTRQIKVLLNDRMSKAHNETPMSEAEIEMVLHEYEVRSDDYSREAARTVVRFLKIFSEHLKEPLIVSLT
jgi:hypothetical protein